MVGQSESAIRISLIERAARDPSVDIEKFERLMAMSERMQAKEAERAFNVAVSAAKGEIGGISKNRQVDFTSQKGRTNYRYEDFAEVARTVDPVLKRHGLAYRFRSSQDGQKLTVTCILSHADGHSEETTLVVAEDHSGNKNSIQAIGSAATYLQRYTLKLALGLASSTDDDGRSAGEQMVSVAQLQELEVLIAKARVAPEKALEVFGLPSLDQMPAHQFEKAKAKLNARIAQIAKGDAS